MAQGQPYRQSPAATNVPARRRGAWTLPRASAIHRDAESVESRSRPDRVQGQEMSAVNRPPVNMVWVVFRWAYGIPGAAFPGLPLERGELEGPGATWRVLFVSTL